MYPEVFIYSSLKISAPHDHDVVIIRGAIFYLTWYLTYLRIVYTINKINDYYISLWSTTPCCIPVCFTWSTPWWCMMVVHFIYIAWCPIHSMFDIEPFLSTDYRQVMVDTAKFVSKDVSNFVNEIYRRHGFLFMSLMKG